ncbi:beta-lactamase family protein, partial [Streptomyces misionensis]
SGGTAPDAAAPRAALAGLPGDDATDALVRVGGTDGARRGSAGVHDLAGGRAADPEARFRAGSLTKVVTAATVLRLAAEGRVGPSTPVQHYLPGLLGGKFGPVTVRQLPNHASGTHFPGAVHWAKSGARYGWANGIAATRDLRRTLVHSVGATDAEGDATNAVTRRIVLAALDRP